MEDRIFFKDKTNTLKGPFIERQVQEWYRKGWFENAFPFYFIGITERPYDEESSGITLDSLRSLNGFGCPFFKVDEKEEREFKKKKREKEEKLESIEKEIAELKLQCDAILCMEKMIERMEREVEKSAMSHGEKEIPSSEEKEEDPMLKDDVEVVKSESIDSKKKNKKKRKDKNKNHISKPDSIPEEFWLNFYQLGISVANLIMDAFEVYATGRFDDWGKNRVKNMVSIFSQVKTEEKEGRDLVCEYILVERMKQKEFYCCSICEDEAFYNYKQTLIHFTSREHLNMETEVVIKSGVDGIRSVLDSFTKLPATLAENDAKIEKNRLKRNGTRDLIKDILDQYRPSRSFGRKMKEEYVSARKDFNMVKYTQADAGRISYTVYNTMFEVELAKGIYGQKMFAELHEHLGEGVTSCLFCDCITVDRDGFYAHFISSSHLRNIANSLKEVGNESRTDILSTLVNVHKKDLI